MAYEQGFVDIGGLSLKLCSYGRDFFCGSGTHSSFLLVHEIISNAKIRYITKSLNLTVWLIAKIANLIVMNIKFSLLQGQGTQQRRGEGTARNGSAG